MMKAIVYQNYGSPDVLELKEIEKPNVMDDELLIKVHAAAVIPFDWHFMTGTPFLARIMAGGLFKPKHKVLGTQVSGLVEAVGENVKRFQPGDEVFGRSVNCGGFAEYVCISEDDAWSIPAGMSFEEAAAVLFSAISALICLCDLGQIQSGQKVLINGASGGLGTLAVPIAKSFGAQVTGVCSTRNLDMVRSIGADQVIDYTQKDFTQNGARYDLIFDAVGVRSFSDCKRVLSPEGIYVTTEFSPALVLMGFWISKTGSQKMIPMPPIEPKPEIKELFVELLEAGKLTPVIDICYPLSEVPEAFRYYEKGHTQGRVIITI
ncbi:NAD(P)-dependent alcohol dehydrogenase [Chloroflexota bacterium]